MTRLSSRQYSLLKQIPARFHLDDALKYNQNTFGSFAIRGYVKRVGKKFNLTDEARTVLDQFGSDDVFRKLVTDKISVHFREQLATLPRQKKNRAA